jgi:hypothetical protein
MRELSETFEGVEFSLVRGIDSAGKPSYILRSGRVGEPGQVMFDVKPTDKILSHTHPVGGDNFASFDDMAILDRASNKVSRIILLDGEGGKLITFTAINEQRSIRSLIRAK